MLSYRKGARRLLLRRETPELFEAAVLDARTDHVGSRLLTWDPYSLSLVDWRSGPVRGLRWDESKIRLLYEASADRAGNLVLVELSGRRLRDLRGSARVLRPGDADDGGQTLWRRGSERITARFCGSTIVEWGPARVGAAIYVRRTLRSKPRLRAILPAIGDWDPVCDASRAGIIYPHGDEIRRTTLSWTRIR